MDRYAVIRPLLMRLDAETAHNLTLKALACGIGPRARTVDDPALNVTLWNRRFPNPVGLAAGFDKNAEVVDPAFRMGFGFVEAGTVTPRPQDGNPKPRVFRDADNNAVINRMGFPNNGLDSFRRNVERFRAGRNRPQGLLGINIGMNKGQTEPARDYCQLVRQLGPLADYLTINISSPNTPGLRDLQSPEAFLDLTRQVLEERARSCGPNPPPILVKLAPDLDPARMEALAQAAIESGIDGLILTNTTLDRPPSLDPEFAAQAGGLSGAPVRDKSNLAIAGFYRLIGERLPIIGLGGIFSAEDAYAKIRAGASLVQIYTGLIYRGPALVTEVNRGLSALLKRDGLSHISQAVGLDHRPAPRLD